MYRQKQNVTYMRERAPQKHMFRSPNTSADLSTQLWHGAVYNDNILTLGKFMSMRASGATELRQFSHFHILKLLFPFIFCWYFYYFVSETYICSSLKLHAGSFLLLRMVGRYTGWPKKPDRQCGPNLTQFSDTR